MLTIVRNVESVYITHWSFMFRLKIFGIILLDRVLARYGNRDLIPGHMFLDLSLSYLLNDLWRVLAPADIFNIVPVTAVAFKEVHLKSAMLRLLLIPCNIL